MFDQIPLTQLRLMLAKASKASHPSPRRRGEGKNSIEHLQTCPIMRAMYNSTNAIWSRDEWQGCIDRYRDILLRILASMFVMLGSDTKITRHTRNAICRILRPAESSVRRLIYIYMKAFAVTVPSRAKKSNATSLGAKFKKGKDAEPSADAVPAFKLYDTYKKFDFQPRRKISKIQPRIHFFGVPSPVVPPDPLPPSSDDPLDASAIAGRLKALQAALDDVPKQAHRMAREEKRRETVEAGPGKVPPLRPGYAPGHKQRPKHEVDFILHECEALACDVREAPT